MPNQINPNRTKLMQGTIGVRCLMNLVGPENQTLRRSCLAMVKNLLWAGRVESGLLRLLLTALWLRIIPLVVSVGSLLGLKLRNMNSTTERWAMFLKGKVIPIGDQMIDGIQRDPTDIMGWYEEEALVAWKNIFPLTEVSDWLGYLPMEDEAWVKTPNPYWHFLMDRPKFPLLVNIPSEQQGNPFWKHLYEESMSALETIHLETTICQRKILIEKPMEMVVVGNLFLLKLLQFSMPKIACTLNILSN